MDAIDKRILSLLQADATLSVAAIAEQVGLTTTPCWRRIQALEQAGVIQRRVAILDPGKLGLGLTVFVRLRTARHDAAWLETFARRVPEIPDVVEVYRLSGDVDYLLKVVVPDIAGYDAVYKRLVSIAEFADVSANFSMERIKATTALPLDHLD
jgi:Lrp/AsnC family transcriptional regulator